MTPERQLSRVSTTPYERIGDCLSRRASGGPIRAGRVRRPWLREQAVHAYDCERNVVHQSVAGANERDPKERRGCPPAVLSESMAKRALTQRSRRGRPASHTTSTGEKNA